MSPPGASALPPERREVLPRRPVVAARARSGAVAAGCGADASSNSSSSSSSANGSYGSNFEDPPAATTSVRPQIREAYAWDCISPHGPPRGTRAGQLA